MNRNVNMTGNFSNGKSLKPGDTAFNNRKLTGGDQYGGSRVMNTNSNFNARNTNTDMGRDKYKFNENDMNEAKESLKLLKLKMGGGINAGIGGNMNNNPMSSMGNMNTINTYGNKINNNYGGYGNNNVMNTVSHTKSNSNTNSNYRKPFKPNFNNDMSENIPTETNKKVTNSRVHTNNMNTGNNKFGNNNSNMNNNAMNNKVNKKKFEVKELEDDRPAFATGAPNLDDIEPEDDVDDGDRMECPTCGRRFKEEAYVKHSKVCKKVFASKRKTFDMKNQRIIDSEHAMLLKHKEYEDKKKAKIGVKETAANANKKNKWKKQSEEFRAILRANKTTSDFPSSSSNNKGGINVGNPGMGRTNYNQQRGGTSGGMGYTKPSVITEDYTHCNMCNRRYNEQAYSKHLPTCERRTKEAAIKSKGKPVANNTLGGNNMQTGNTMNGTYGSKPNLNVKFGRK